jgi:putative thioredoxin
MSTYELRSDFTAEVLEASKVRPVLVDFWAEWCGPCRILSPILEKLAKGADGKWTLVTIDADVHQELAARYDIRGIPAVKLFRGGQPVAEFVGALPEDQVRAWLARHLPPKGAREADAAAEALSRGDERNARIHLQRALAHDPQDTRAKLLLARLLFAEDVDASADLARQIPEGDPGHETAGHLLRLAGLVRWGRNGAEGGGEGPEADLALYREGARDLAHSRYGEALAKWIELIGRNRGLDDDGPRKACIALFAVLGPDNPVTREFRPRLAAALY